MGPGGGGCHGDVISLIRREDCNAFEKWVGSDSTLWKVTGDLSVLVKHQVHVVCAYVAVPCRNRILLRRVFRSRHCVQSAVSPNFR